MDIPDHILCFHSRYGIRDISGGAGAMKDYPLSLLLYTLGVVILLILSVAFLSGRIGP